MKFRNDKDQSSYQRMLEKQLEIKAELQQLQDQIEQFEKQYLQNTWNDGNISVGWSKVNAPPPPANGNKIQLVAKDKIFSLSSTSSNANYSLGQIADKNLAPLPQNKFQQSYVFRYVRKKQLEKKKNKGGQLKRKLIRRRRR